MKSLNAIKILGKILTKECVVLAVVSVILFFLFLESDLTVRSKKTMNNTMLQVKLRNIIISQCSDKSASTFHLAHWFWTFWLDEIQDKNSFILINYQLCRNASVSVCPVNFNRSTGDSCTFCTLFNKMNASVHLCRKIPKFS